jgi:hypothetical protein
MKPMEDNKEAILLFKKQEAYFKQFDKDRKALEKKILNLVDDYTKDKPWLRIHSRRWPDGNMFHIAVDLDILDKHLKDEV